MHCSPHCLSLLALVAALTGCATAPPAPPQRETPPAYLLQDCQEPRRELKTNRDIAEYVLDLKIALRGCNADKRAIREWAEKE